MTAQKNEFKMELIKAKKTNLRMKRQTQFLIEDNKQMWETLKKDAAGELARETVEGFDKNENLLKQRELDKQ